MKFTMFWNFGVGMVWLVALMTTGCASTAGYKLPGHKTFTPENVELLQVGMDPSAVRQLFGVPDEEYDMQFGEDVGRAWEGRVWVYFTEVDHSLQYVTRYKKYSFVFYPLGPNMRLNHWDQDEM